MNLDNNLYPDSYQNKLIIETLEDYFGKEVLDIAGFLDALEDAGLKIGYPSVEFNNRTEPTLLPYLRTY